MVKLYEYKVTGRGSFPLDMLRYDRAWPAYESEISAFAWEASTRTLTLRSYQLPTTARWSSFLWAVGEVVTR
jgi:hypothetical protein